jgi:hypothetical protein
VNECGNVDVSNAGEADRRGRGLSHAAGYAKAVAVGAEVRADEG